MINLYKGGGDWKYTPHLRCMYSISTGQPAKLSAKKSGKSENVKVSLNFPGKMMLLLLPAAFLMYLNTWRVTQTHRCDLPLARVKNRSGRLMSLMNLRSNGWKKVNLMNHKSNGWKRSIWWITGQMAEKKRAIWWTTGQMAEKGQSNEPQVKWLKKGQSDEPEVKQLKRGQFD